MGRKPEPRQPAPPLPAEPAPRQWLLMLSLALLAGWVAFLLGMALVLGRFRP